MKTKNYFTTLLFLVISFSSFAQEKYFTKTGRVSFFSDSPMEKIEAHNNRATSVIEVASGKIEFSLLVKGFEFDKALMQEHFNENYMESDEYPKATFTGMITNIKSVDFTKDGNYDITVEGELTIHGVTQKITTKAMIIVSGGKISAKGSFSVNLSDYKVKRPKAVAETVKIEVEIKEYAPLIKK